jgi:RNA polymerase sigma factor (sigma-70 family)
MVLGVCRRVLHNPHDAEDVFQATFLIFVRKAHTLKSPSNVGSWLYGVAYRTALHARNAAVKRRVKEAEMVRRTVKADDTWAELRPALDQELERLPEKYRAVIVLCDLEGKSRKETARQLGLPEGTVASRLATARKTLAKRLARLGLAISGGALAAMLDQNAAACLPPSVLTSLVKAASIVAAGQSLAGVISANVAASAERGIKTMLLMKLKSLFMLVATLTAFTAGLGFFTYHGFAQQAVNGNTTEPMLLATPVPLSDDAKSPADEKAAHYCWLGFGPKAKVRALVRVEGEEVAIDRDGDGKFDSQGERFQSENDCRDVVISDSDGKTSYVITSVHLLHVVPPEKYLVVRVHIRGPVSYPQCCIVQMANHPKGAPLAHFHGPLKMSTDGWRIVNRATRLLENSLVNVDGLLPQSLRDLAGKELATESTLPKSLNLSAEPAYLYAGIATDGDGTHVAICSPSDDPEKRRETAPFPKDIHPFVDMEFPAKNRSGPPIKKRYPLDEFCCDGFYRGPVRVPDDAGSGTAKVTFSFDAWKEGNVAPITVELPVDDSEVQKPAQKAPGGQPSATARRGNRNPATEGDGLGSLDGLVSAQIEEVKAELESMNQAIWSGHYGKGIDLMPPYLVEKQAGRTRLLATMERVMEKMKSRFTLRSYQIGDPVFVVHGCNGYITFPTRTELGWAAVVDGILSDPKSGSVATSQAFAVGISLDNGRTWKYVNGDQRAFRDHVEDLFGGWVRLPTLSSVEADSPETRGSTPGPITSISH